MLPAMFRNTWFPTVFDDFDFTPRANTTAPAVNVMENETAYTMEVAAPGIKKEFCRVNINEDGNLCVAIENKWEHKEEDKEKLLEGVELSDGVTKADELEYIDAHDHRQLGIEIHSGKNRIVRRMFEALGYEVRALDRVYFAGLTKKGLKKSDWRYLTEGEVNILKMGAYV